MHVSFSPLITAKATASKSSQQPRGAMLKCCSGAEGMEAWGGWEGGEGGGVQGSTKILAACKRK